jgi:MFS transporter, putative metabolite:H+ symporter
MECSRNTKHPKNNSGMTQKKSGWLNAQNLMILVAALGYFVDIYDLVLFSIVRMPSLRSIGVPESELLNVGVDLLNYQMGGMLLGGIIWGIVGDKKGRLSVLFGSILMYSLANIFNGMVTTVPAYAALRFIAGMGLAGELGAGITLVSEIMHKDKRGLGTTLVATIGISGAVVAALVGDFFDWRIAYYIGGAMGLALLLLRMGVYESGMFKEVKSKKVKRGNFMSLILNKERALRYFSVIAIAVPVWFVVGILITFSPEVTKAMGMSGALPDPGKSIMFAYIGITLGDLASGLLSQYWRSRKKVIALFLSLTVLMCVAYFLFATKSLFVFYSIAVLIGFATGYWAVFMTAAAEQFGTNIRATATTTAPNFVRGAVIPITILFKFLSPEVGVTNAAILVGTFTMILAYIALYNLKETFGKDLNFTEDD